MDNKLLIERRERLLGPNNPLFYDTPIHLVKGEGVWLYSAEGERYLDCYNNVPSVGHCHPRVVETLARQASMLNIHTRYLHEGILDYRDLLLSKFDGNFDRMALCCTGSEANELALRIAKLNTGGVGFICTNATYHGNTAAVAQLSSIFKPFEGIGDHVQMVSWPDTYRTKNGLSGKALAKAYADEILAAIGAFKDKGISFSGMIVCPIFANEGLPEMLKSYLQMAIQHVHNAGGLFICDEVQSGFGRTGHWWGYQESNIVPDIITLGKPMAAGHPVAGVVSRSELLDNFRNQEMYFNTYAGNTVSCAVAKTVIDVIDDEGLLENVRHVSASLREKFDHLQKKYELIGDVRGRGLFFGIEIVKSRDDKEPAPLETRKVVNWMRHNGVLMSNIGEYDNVLKIRPPMCFSEENADQLISTLDRALSAL